MFRKVQDALNFMSRSTFCVKIDDKFWGCALYAFGHLAWIGLIHMGWSCLMVLVLVFLCQITVML